MSAAPHQPPELPPLPFAVFDEFGQSADDRISDYGYRCAAEAVRAALAAPPTAERSMSHPWGEPNDDGEDPGAEADYLRELLTWSYSKLHYRSFDSVEDALMLDRIKTELTDAAPPTPRGAA